MSDKSNTAFKIKNLGVTAGLSVEEKKSVMLVNIMTQYLFVLSIISVGGAFVWGAPKAVFVLSFPIVWAGVFQLNHMKQYHLASAVFCLAGLITSAGLAIVFEQYQFYFWLIPLSLSPFLIFSSKYKQWGNLFSGGIWLAFSVFLYLATRDAFSIVISLSSLLLLSLGVYARNIALLSEFQLKEERGHSETLLRNFIPKKFVRRLMSLGGEAPMIAQRYEEVIVLFADIVNFTPMSEELPPEQLVQVLNELFTEFDILIAKYGLEKIKTIGDAYMIAAGVPEPMDDPEIAVADFALEMRGVVQKVDRKWKRDLDIRIGIHLGPVVAGVIGIQKYAFDLWGDTVNVAARMESHGLPGQIHLSEVMADKLKNHYVLTQRGWVDVKGKGMMQTFWLKGKEASATQKIEKRHRLASSDLDVTIEQTMVPKAKSAKALGKSKSQSDIEKTTKPDQKSENASKTEASKSLPPSASSQSQPSKPPASSSSKSLPPKSSEAKSSKRSLSRSGAFRKTMSPEDSRSDLFQKKNPRAGATLPPSGINSLTNASFEKETKQAAQLKEESSGGVRSNPFRKATSPVSSGASDNKKGANAFRKSKK